MRFPFLTLVATTFLTTALLGCASEGATPSAAAADPATDEAHVSVSSGKAPTTLWTVPGFYVDFQGAVAAGPEDGYGGRGTPGTLQSFASYGVDAVGVWGDFHAGYVGALAAKPSAEVNGMTVGVMDVRVNGASASRLYDAMVRATQTQQGTAVVRSSALGRLTCSRDRNTTTCVVSGVVGIDNSSLYFH